MSIFFCGEEMKTKIRILMWFSLVLSLTALIELARHHNWRVRFGMGSWDLSEDSLVDHQVGFTDLPIYISHFGAKPADVVKYRSNIKLLAVTDNDPDDIGRVRDVCCSDAAGCDLALEQLHQKLENDSGFLIIHDSSCGETTGLRIADNIAFTTRNIEPVIKVWEGVQRAEFSGPMSLDRGLVVVRLLMINSAGDSSTPARIVWTHVQTIERQVRVVLAELSPIVEVILDTQTVYSGDIYQLLKTLDGSVDEYEASRLINSEVEVWSGTSHLLEFGAYAMPPLDNIAIFPSKDGVGLYDVSDWGVLSVVDPDDLFKCGDSVCELSEEGAKAISNIFISLVRKWLGLAPEKCLGCFSNDTRIFSTTEKIHLMNARRKFYIDSAATDLRKQQKVLSSLPRLAFPAQVADMMDEVVQLVSKSRSEKNLTEGVRLAKVAATLAGEALRHESVVAPSSFSLEYLFALYAPAGLPIIFPVISALISLWKARRNRKSEKVD